MEFDDSNNFCPYCGEAKATPAEPAGARVQPLGEQLRGLRNERLLYIGLAIVPFAIGLALLLTVKALTGSSIALVMMVLILYGTARFSKYMGYSGKEYLVAIVLVLFAYIGSFIYMLLKSRRFEAHLKGEPPPSWTGGNATVAMVGAGVLINWGLVVGLLFAFGGPAKPVVTRVPVTSGDTTSRQEESRLFSISAVDSEHAWAAGDEGTFFFDGSSWKHVDTGTDYAMQSVSALDESHVWVAGAFNTILFYDGKSWRKEPLGVVNNFNSIDALDPKHVWAVGWESEVSFFDGKDWSTQDTGAFDNLLSVSASDSEHVWAVTSGLNLGEGSIFFYDGDEWKLRKTPGKQQHSLNAVFALDARHVWAVGDGGDILYFDGKTWKEQRSGTEQPLYGVSALDEKHVWAVGYGGTVVFYDGGSWKALDAGEEVDFLGVCALDARHVWVVGYGDAILFFDGKSWKVQNGSGK